MIQKGFTIAVAASLFVLGFTSFVSAQESEKGMVLIEVVDEYGKSVNIGWKQIKKLNTKKGEDYEVIERDGDCHVFDMGEKGKYSMGWLTQYLYCAPFSKVWIRHGESLDQLLVSVPILSKGVPLTSFRLHLPVGVNKLIFPKSIVVREGVSTGTHRVVKSRVFNFQGGDIDPGTRYVVENSKIKVQVEKGSMSVYRLRLRKEPFAYVQVQVGRHVKADSISGMLVMIKTDSSGEVISLKRSGTRAVSPGMYSFKWVPPADKKEKCRVLGVTEAEVTVNDVCTNEQGKWMKRCLCLPHEQLIVMKSLGKVTWKKEVTELLSTATIGHIDIRLNKKRIQLGDVVNIKVGDKIQVTVKKK